MDPNQNLKEQRQLVQDMLRDRRAITTSNAERLAELMFELDEWIIRGGFLPAAWSKKDAAA